MQLDEVRLGIEHRITTETLIRERSARLMTLPPGPADSARGSDLPIAAAAPTAAREPAPFQRDFFQTGDLHRLAALDGLHELSGIEQVFVRSRIEPGEATAEQLHVVGRARGRRG